MGFFCLGYCTRDQGRTGDPCLPAGRYRFQMESNAHGENNSAQSARDQGRTGDLPLFRRALYQLSYPSTLGRIIYKLIFYSVALL